MRIISPVHLRFAEYCARIKLCCVEKTDVSVHRNSAKSISVCLGALRKVHKTRNHEEQMYKQFQECKFECRWTESNPCQCCEVQTTIAQLCISSRGVKCVIITEGSGCRNNASPVTVSHHVVLPQKRVSLKYFTFGFVTGKVCHFFRGFEHLG